MRLSVLATVLLAVPATAADVAGARELYQRTEYAAAFRLLRAEKTLDAEGYALAGKITLMQGDVKNAIDYLQKATSLEPANPEYVLWLGRAWGRKAEHSSPFTAMSAASHTREYFEKAVALDPQSREATGDLFDYYMDAPGIVGGGVDKAEALAKRIEAFDPPEGRFDFARIAVKRKRFDEAERDFRASVKQNPRAVGHPLGLARFLAEQGRIAESDQVLDEADKEAPDNVRLLFGRASIYVESHRKLAEARQLLERYLASSLTPDDPAREDARKLLHRAGGS